MREKKVLISIALTIMIAAILFSLPKAHAATPFPTIYVDTTLNRVTPLLTPITVTSKAAGATQAFYIKVARAPHETTEPTALGTDKTFAYQFRLNWDNTMFGISNIATRVSEEPATVTTTAGFLKRRMYSYDPDGSTYGYIGWGVAGTYSTSFQKSNDTGTLLVGNTLTADPTPSPLPPEYFDPDLGLYAPDKTRHLGANYDLPYTVNATQAVPQPDPDIPTTVTDPTYILLGIVTLTSRGAPPADYAGSAFHLSDVLLFDYGEPNPRPYLPVDTFDAYYIKVPVVPEFPLGLGLAMLLTTAIPVVYVWRTRKKVTHK